MKKLSFFILLAMLISCDENEPPKSTRVNIRITNVSQFDYEDVVVNPSREDFNYGSIKAQGSTDYHQFESAYSYAFVELKINGEIFRIQPIDYVGERYIEAGNYTYQIDAEPTGDLHGRLSMSLVKD